MTHEEIKIFIGHNVWEKIYSRKTDLILTFEKESCTDIPSTFIKKVTSTSSAKIEETKFQDNLEVAISHW